MTIFSPKSVGRHETRKSISLSRAVDGEADLDAAVLRQALLGDVQLRHDLDARRDRVAELHRRRHDVVEDAVDAEPDAELLLVRLDVDVARALLNRRHQHQVDEPDDRRLAALPLERGDVNLLELLEHLDVVVDDCAVVSSSALVTSSSVAALVRFACCGGGFGLSGFFSAAFCDLGRGRRGGRVVALDGVGDGRFRRDDRLHVVARHELDVVHGEHVRGVGDGDRERRARAAERDDLILLRGVGGDQLDDRLVDLELREVDRGNAVLLAEKRRDLFVGDEAELDEIQAKLAAVGLLIVQRLLQLRRSDALFFQKQIADADGHRYNSDRLPRRGARRARRAKLAAQSTASRPDHVSRRGRTRWGR